MNNHQLTIHENQPFTAINHESLINIFMNCHSETQETLTSLIDHESTMKPAPINNL